ncbi:sensor histidine kinase, partial [Xanthomonas oryzae pv. oryzae]
MLGYLSHTRVLRFAGLFTWAMIVMPLVYTYWPPAEEGDHRSVAEAVMMSAFFIGFGASYFWLTRGLNSGGHAHWYDRLILLLLTICALAVSYLSGTGLGSILMMVAAGVIPWLLPLRVGVLWLVLSQLAVLPVFYYLRP